MNYYENYNASEGYFGIQDQSHSDEMLLMLDYGIYYEFIPIENTDEKQPHKLTNQRARSNACTKPLTTE